MVHDRSMTNNRTETIGATMTETVGAAQDGRPPMTPVLWGTTFPRFTAHAPG